jgi:hypothetical protein
LLNVFKSFYGARAGVEPARVLAPHSKPIKSGGIGSLFGGWVTIATFGPTCLELSVHEIVISDWKIFEAVWY